MNLRLCCFLLLCVSSPFYAAETTAATRVKLPMKKLILPATKSFEEESIAFRKIARFAKKMDIFPIDVVAPKGPLRQSWRFENRYDITLDRYAPFFAYKKFAENLSTQDIDELILCLKKANPKEKALILTAMYIHEWIYRKNIIWESSINEAAFVTDAVMNDAINTRRQWIPQSGENITADWDRWVSVIKKYVHNKSTAFPALTGIDDGGLDELEEEYNESLEQAKSELRRITGDNLFVEAYSDRSRLARQLASKMEGQETFPQYDRDRARMLYEYSWLLYKNHYTYVQDYAIDTESGNSSAKPKTLGDIATQLLSSRFDYEVKPKDEDKTAFRQIVRFAEKMDIFPVDVIATNGKLWNFDNVYRYDVTWDRYALFFAYKKFAENLSAQDIDELILCLKKANSKEKALILTAIYIYEWIHRKNLMNIMIYNGVKFPADNVIETRRQWLPQSSGETTLSDAKWDRWVSVIKKYAHDKSTAFPALTVDDDALEEEYCKMQKHVDAELRRMMGDDHSEMDTPVRQLASKMEGQEILKQDNKVRMLYEYSYLLYKDFYTGSFLVT